MFEYEEWRYIYLNYFIYDPMTIFSWNKIAKKMGQNIVPDSEMISQ